MHKDPIIDKLHKIREAHAAEFNYDLDAMFADLRQEQKRSGAKYITLPAKRIKKTGKSSLKRAV